MLVGAQPFCATLPPTLPTVTIGSLRRLGYGWLDSIYGRPPQEFAFMPFAIEELIVKAWAVIKRNGL